MGGNSLKIKSFTDIRKYNLKKTPMHTLLFMSNVGGYEILLIILVILVFFGAKKIPELARGLGKGIREFKEATSEIKDEIENSVNKKPKISR